MESESVLGFLFTVNLLFGLFAAFYCSTIAGKKNRSTMSWLIYGFFLPAIAILHVIIVDEVYLGPRCQYCIEPVNAKATICPHCQSEHPVAQRAYAGTLLEG